MKKFLKLCLVSFILFLLAAPIVAMGAKEIDGTGPYENPKTLHASVLNGPSGMGMAYLFEHNPDLNGVKCTFEITATPDVLLPKMVKGEIDIGILPTNAAAKIYNANGLVVLGAVVGEGNLYVMSRDKKVHTVADLVGKKVAVAGHGATPDYLLRYLASKALIEIGDGANQINMDFSIPTAEIAPSLIAGKIDYALVPEPFATVCQMKDQSILRSIDLQQLWMVYADEASNYPLTVCVIRKEYAQKYPDTVRMFLDAYRKSIEWTNANPSEAGILVEKYTLGLNATIASKSIPNASFAYVPAVDAKPLVESLLSVFLITEPTAIGGKLPDNNFYFK
jgi:NitT/TauT family transport system substrate-binding protein